MNKIKKKIKDVLKIDKRLALETEHTMRQNQFLPISETQAQDIFIAGFPKSGNTWMQNLIVGLLYGIETSMLPDTLTQELVPDVHGKSYYKRFQEVMFFKTHELPKKEMKRVIHLVRDGRDVMASYYAMKQAMKINISLEDMIIHNKGVYPTQWHLHTKAWINNPYNSDLLVIRYEDLIRDTYTELKKIVKFAQLDCSEDIIHRSIAGNTFKEMRKKEQTYGWNNPNWDKNEDFIRKGKIGTYKSELSEELVKIFEEASKFELQHFNYL